jgi:hypothetical protein
MQIESSTADLLVSWGRWAPQDPGDELDYPGEAPFQHMRGRGVGLPPEDEILMGLVDRAVAGLSVVQKYLVNAHFRRHASYYRIAKRLEITPEEIGVLLAVAIENVEESLHANIAA